jgi:two-component system, OmpR family, sensor histidine kinase CreC
MKLGFRIFGLYLAIFVICFSYPLQWVVETMRTRYLEGIEDPLVDQANILAALVGHGMSAGHFSRDDLNQFFGEIYARDVDARIYQVLKTHVDLRVYITDVSGRLLFDSQNLEPTGTDYSHWRNVRLTLDGRYGARTTLADPDDPTSAILHVAAPILIDGTLLGVLAVAKPTTTINRFLRQVRPELFKRAGLALAAAAVLSYLAAVWMSRPIKRLTDYAEAIRAGKRAIFPALDQTEIGELGCALQKMQDALEGKVYVEQYVQKLTHEIKSPLSAIRGAAELLAEEMPAEQRARFLANIRAEADRIQRIVDRMLELSALEAKKELPRSEPIVLEALLNTIIESKQPLLARKAIALHAALPSGIGLSGDPFLLHQAIANLIQNAIDFSLPGGCIELAVHCRGDRVDIEISDDGAAIPDYAMARIFDKFFSMQRPDSNTKSTGLGLNLVREVALLHQGRIEIQNLGSHGVRATLTLPATRTPAND